jgi:hypothetical protein
MFAFMKSPLHWLTLRLSDDYIPESTTPSNGRPVQFSISYTPKQIADMIDKGAEKNQHSRA